MNGRIGSLIRDYADEQITLDQLEELEQALRADAAVREQLLHELNVRVALEDLAMADGDSAGANNAARPRVAAGEGSTLARTRNLTINGWSLAVAAAIVLAFIAAVVVWRSGEEAEIVTISRAHGPLKWIGSGGRVTGDIDADRRLTGGTLELLSADSWVELRFRDNSTVILSGQSAVTISERYQKELHLRHGSLSANIRPQPDGRPLLVHTDAAELRVLGTQFNVDAQPDGTRLTVNEGRVRLKRLADGREVEVPALFEVTAAMEDHNGLVLIKRVKPVSAWKCNLKSNVVHGKWVSDLWTLGVRLKKAVANGKLAEAEAIAAYEDAATLDDARGSVWAKTASVGSLVVLSVPRASLAPVVMTARGKFRIQGRLHSPQDVEFGMTVNYPGGGFAGKYSLSVASGTVQADGKKFDIELPISDFREKTDSGSSPIGKELCDWWCVTESKSAKLEITSVELID